MDTQPSPQAVTRFSPTLSRRNVMALLAAAGVGLAGGKLVSNAVAGEEHDARPMKLLDLPFFNAAGFDSFGTYTREGSSLHFTADSAIAAGFVREQGAAELFSDAVQVHNAFTRVTSDGLGLVSFISQHRTPQGASSWFRYVTPQLMPEGVDPIAVEAEFADEYLLGRFTFPSTMQPGATATRVTGAARYGNIVSWFSLDGIDFEPDADSARRYQWAIGNAAYTEWRISGSLAPVTLLPPSVLACADHTLVVASDGLPGVRALQEAADDCYPRTIDVQYTVTGGEYRPRTGQPDQLTDMMNAFNAGARKSVEIVSINDPTTGETMAINIIHWDDPSVLENNGEEIVARTGPFDFARRTERAEIEFKRGPAEYRPQHPYLQPIVVPPPEAVTGQDSGGPQRLEAIIIGVEPPPDAYLDPDYPPVIYELPSDFGTPIATPGATPEPALPDATPVSFGEAFTLEELIEYIELLDELGVDPHLTAFVFNTSPDSALYGVEVLIVTEPYSFGLTILRPGPAYEPGTLEAMIGEGGMLDEIILSAAPYVDDLVFAAGVHSFLTSHSDVCGGSCDDLPPSFGLYYHAAAGKFIA